MDMPTMAMGSAAVPADHRQPEGKGGCFCFQELHIMCQKNHLVIEMLRELDEDMQRTLAKCFQFRLVNHWTEDEDMLWLRWSRKRTANSQ